MSDSSLVEQGGARHLVLEVADARVAITRWGTGPVIVCLHAIGHAARDYAQLAEELGSRYEFIGIDWPGHEQSPRDAGAVTARHYAALLAEIIDALEISSAYILGNSIGGAAAMLYAASHPDRVRGLILCDPAGLQPIGFIARLVCRRMAKFFAGSLSGATSFEARFRRYYEREVLPSPAARWRREEIIASARQSAPLLVEAWEGFARPETDLRHLAPEITCPVLLAWARRDKYVAWSRSKRAALRFPDRTVRLFEAGHSAFLEQPKQFAEVLLQFAAADLAPAPSASAGRRSDQFPASAAGALPIRAP